MPRLAILGATGKLGQLLTSQALELGFDVNVLARDPRKVTLAHERLTLTEGDAETGAGLDAVLQGCTWAVSALGSSLRPMLERSMAQLIPRLEQRTLMRRFVFVSRLGTGESRSQSRQASGALQSALPVLLMPVFRDINLAEARVRASSLPWTILRSTRLTDDAPTGNVITVGARERPPHRIARADLAGFILRLVRSTDLLGAEATVGSG